MALQSPGGQAASAAPSSWCGAAAVGSTAEQELLLQPSSNTEGWEPGTTPARIWVPRLPAPRQQEVAVPGLKSMGAEHSEVCPGPRAAWPPRWEQGSRSAPRGAPC